MRRAVVILDLRFGRMSRMEPKSPRRILVALMRSEHSLPKGAHDTARLEIDIKTVDVHCHVGQGRIGVNTNIGVAGNGNACQFVVNMEE